MFEVSDTDLSARFRKERPSELVVLEAGPQRIDRFESRRLPSGIQPGKETNSRSQKWRAERDPGVDHRSPQPDSRDSNYRDDSEARPEDPSDEPHGGEEPLGGDPE